MGITVFEIDVDTPHPGLMVEQHMAARETNGGWVTLRATKPLTQDNHQWAVRIVDQGEGNDGSGLMVGIIPRLAPALVAGMGTKYISELGGWCLSRGGDCYGSWKCDKLPFGTGSVVEFDLDMPSKTLYIVCGRERAMAHIPGLADDEQVYPAFSMYYLSQKIMFV